MQLGSCDDTLGRVLRHNTNGTQRLEIPFLELVTVGLGSQLTSPLQIPHRCHQCNVLGVWVVWLWWSKIRLMALHGLVQTQGDTRNEPVQQPEECNLFFHRVNLDHIHCPKSRYVSSRIVVELRLMRTTDQPNVFGLTSLFCFNPIVHANKW